MYIFINVQPQLTSTRRSQNYCNIKQKWKAIFQYLADSLSNVYFSRPFGNSLTKFSMWPIYLISRMRKIHLYHSIQTSFIKFQFTSLNSTSSKYLIPIINNNIEWYVCKWRVTHKKNWTICVKFSIKIENWVIRSDWLSFEFRYSKIKLQLKQAR